ncbi:MAG: hypothetical protein JWO45_1993 [Spartobacteria bacterium]|nr:hypothetical protein [Spartobacteria bacterium]
MKKLRSLLCIIFALLCFTSSGTAQSILYAATGSFGIPGSIYQIDVTTGVISGTHALTNAAGGAPIGLTGLAWNPAGTILYGVTNSASPNSPNHLVTVDPLTGHYVDIGSLGSGIKVSDISFRANGTLYGFQAGGTDNGIPRALFTIALSGPNAGKATSVATTDLTITSGGGIAFSPVATADGKPAGTLFLSATGSVGTLDTLSLLGSNARTVGPSMTGALYLGMGALAFDAAGTLWGADNDGLGQATVSVALETINLVNGAVGGPNNGQGWDLLDNTDAIAFAPIPEPSTAALLISSAIGSIALVYRHRR